jgi:hypothetical protein
MLWLGSKVVGCSTGNLDGSVPFKLLSFYLDNWKALIAKPSRLPPLRQHNTRAYCGIT